MTDQPMIIVSSLNAAETARERYHPGFIISILDEGDLSPSVLNDVAPERHLTLNSATVEEAKWCPLVLDFANKWVKSGESLLIHCHRGVARSMAIAYILMCVKEKNVCEQKIAGRLRAAAPHADPNLLLISEADRMLGRDDRMISAVLDMCPCCSTVAAPIVTLPVAP